MNQPSHPEPLSGLPPDLAELDAELAQFSAAERPSFAPELEAELEARWIRGPGRPGGAFVRRLAAASVVSLTLTGLAVPPARASLVDGFQRLLDAFQAPAPVMADIPVMVPQGAAEVVPTTTLPAVQVPPPASQPAAEVVTTASAEELPAFSPVSMTFPTLVDEGADREVIRRHYPEALQRAGVGGTVGLLLWVAEDGSVDNVQAHRNSGVPALDRAAMQGARSLRFHPATRDGVPVGTYVEFDLVFEPVPMEEEWTPPEVVPVADPELPDGFAYELPDEGPLTFSVPTNIRMEARELLGLAMGASEESVEARLGSLDGILAGEPPAGVSPLRWRSDVVRELERAMARDPDNPAPPLALARIRRKQGLRAEARDLLSRGLERAERGARPVSPRLVAELNFELGSIVRESWLTAAHLGTVPAQALDGLACSRRDGAGSEIGTLVAWNYVCPADLGAVMAASFEPVGDGPAERRAMLDRFEAALDAFPGHVGANVAILLDAADDGIWRDVLNDARRFAWATQGHPYSFLLSGLALQRLGRAEEAMDDFSQAFVVLGEDVEATFRDVAVLDLEVGPDGEDPWRNLDPILNTSVNERETEHLARAAYAYLRFGGLDSDAARLWLRYGRPETVRAFGTADLRTEFWDYGQGPDLTFSRPATSDTRTYTPEAAAYLEDLRSVFPHWYGTRARSLFSLPAQAARFRGDAPGTGELDVQLEVPQALETFEGDSLDLGLFVLAADGSRLSATTQRIAGDSVRLRTGFGADAAGLAVELYNPRTHQAAALRLPAFRGADPTEDRRISDLMLVRPAAPMERDIGRSDAWVSPLGRPDVVDDDQVGILFELYDLPAEGDRFYRVRVELEGAQGGASRAASFRPGGQTLFGTEWTRSPAGRGGRAVEYLTVDLADVASGVYTIRVRVERPDGSEVVEERAGVRIRTEADDSAPAGAGLEAAYELF